MVFKYKIPRKHHQPAPAYNAQLQTQDEGLTGFINGEPASDLEERFARALDRDNRVSSYTFREAVIAARNLPGQLEVDFVVNVGPLIYPIQVDGEFAHKGKSKKDSDRLKDIQVDNYFHQWAAQPVLRIDGDKLATQRQANDLVRDLL